jgi:hypothetical protein
VIGVEQWAEIRRMHFGAGLSIKEIVRRTGRDRNTVRKALRSSEPPRYRRPARSSKLDPFREEVHRLRARSRVCRVSGSASCSSSRATRPARRSLTTTCARCGRCLRPGASTSGRSTGRGSSSLTRGSSQGRCRSATGRHAAATSSSAVCPTRGSAPARRCSRRRRPISCPGSAAAWSRWAP